MLSTGSVIRVCGQVAVSGLHRYQARYGVGIVCYKFLIYLDWPTLASWNVRGMHHLREGFKKKKKKCDKCHTGL